MVNNVNYSLDEIKAAAKHLVETGMVDRHQPICVLYEYLPPRELICVEEELKINDYLPHDCICDLLNLDQWEED